MHLDNKSPFPDNKGKVVKKDKQQMKLAMANLQISKSCLDCLVHVDVFAISNAIFSILWLVSKWLCGGIQVCKLEINALYGDSSIALTLNTLWDYNSFIMWDMKQFQCHVFLLMPLG